MALSPILTDVKPVNLTRAALADYLRLLAYSQKHWGLGIALKTRDRLLSRFAEIATGRAVGYHRPDIQTDTPLLYLSEKPFVIAYDPTERLIVRILHQARDMPQVLR